MFLNYGIGEDSWESLGQQEIKPVNLKGNQPWIFIGRTDAEAPILWPVDGKGWPTGKDPDAGKDWGQGRRGQQRVRHLDCITNSKDMNLSKLQETVKDREAWRAAVHGWQRVRHEQTWTWMTEQQQQPSGTGACREMGELEHRHRWGKIRWRRREKSTIPKPKRDVGTNHRSWLSEENHPAHTLISDLRLQASGTGHPHRSMASSHSMCGVFS